MYDDEMLIPFIDLYSNNPENPYISVLLHKGLSKLPKTYIAICDKDTLRDDARLLKKRLDQFG
jgi:acetyl esterase/lipase